MVRAIMAMIFSWNFRKSGHTSWRSAVLHSSNTHVWSGCVATASAKARKCSRMISGRAMLIVDGFCNLGIKPSHLFKHCADQRLPGREVKEYRRHRHLSFARDFSVTSGADAATGEDVNRTSKEQGAPLGFIQRLSAATTRAMSTISHAQMSDT